MNLSFLLFTFVLIHSVTPDALLSLPNGLILGDERRTLNNKTYYAFQKIPYAAPPIGDLRFQPPQPATNWDGVLNATTDIDVTCFQTALTSDTQSEDCLYLNIFTPYIPVNNASALMPVMVYIHGGGFVRGSSITGPRDLIVENDVVLVTINYRLGLFGFLSTQDEVIPGNNGLKDQQFAIQWVHDNIQQFAGNPSKVTIVGGSAGSASCSYQLINQKNYGLFQGAILESGSLISPWAYQRRPREIAFEVTSLLNATFETNNNSQDLLNFLLSVDAQNLNTAAILYQTREEGPENLQLTQGLAWAPVIEVENPDAFITKKMYGLLQAGNFVKVPIIIGINSEESLYFSTDENVLREKLSAYDDHLDWVVPNDMGISNFSAKLEMGRLIREMYTEGEPWADHLGDGVRYSSDTSFTRSIIRTAELVAPFVNTYFYVFSFEGSMNNINVSYDGAEKVAHGAQNFYFSCSGTDCDDSQWPESDRITRQRLVSLWTNFAKQQNPTPEPSELLQNLTWITVPSNADNGDLYYLDINENLDLKNHPKEVTYRKWRELYNSLGYDDFDTY